MLGNKESKAQQGSTDSTEVHSSINKSAQEDPATPPAKIARFEMETSSTKTWELPAGLADYINRYMSHHVTDKEVTEKIINTNSISSNIKGTPISDNYIKQILLENKRTLTFNREEAFKSTHNKVSHVFGPLLRLWGIIKEEEESGLQDLSENCSLVLAVLPFLSNLFYYWVKFLIPSRIFEERTFLKHLLMPNLK